MVGVAPVHRRRDILKEKSEGPSAGLSSLQKQENPHLAGLSMLRISGRGNLNWFFKSLIFQDLIIFCFCLEYSLEY